MKRRMTALVAALAAVLMTLTGSPTTAHAVGGGNVSIWWDFNGGPSSVPDLTFPITVATGTAHWDGTYFAQQFNFTGTGPVAYTGVQPMADTATGQDRMRFLFSSFDGNSTSTHPNCSDGADGGGGTTCRVELPATYGHTFNMRVRSIATDTWEGTVTDTTTGVSTSVGSWKIPGSRSLRTSQVGFVEYYAGVPSCTELPRIEATFGAPFSSTGAVGRSGTNGEYSDCVGKTTYSATPVGNGIKIIRGSVLPFRVRHTTSARCLDNLNGSGTVPALWDCNGGGNQSWYTTTSRLLKNNGRCLDARGEGTTAGTPIILYPCHGRSNQQWRINADGTITGIGSGLCLTPVGSGTGNGTRLELGSCSAAKAKWTKV